MVVAGKNCQALHETAIGHRFTVWKVYIYTHACALGCWLSQWWVVHFPLWYVAKINIPWPWPWPWPWPSPSPWSWWWPWPWPWRMRVFTWRMCVHIYYAHIDSWSVRHSVHVSQHTYHSICCCFLLMISFPVNLHSGQSSAAAQWKRHDGDHYHDHNLDAWLWLLP